MMKAPRPRHSPSWAEQPSQVLYKLLLVRKATLASIVAKASPRVHCNVPGWGWWWDRRLQGSHSVQLRPRLLRKPGLFFRQGADRVSAPTAALTTRWDLPTSLEPSSLTVG